MEWINIENRHFLAGVNQNPNDLNVQKTGIQLISLYKFKKRKKLKRNRNFIKANSVAQD